MDDTRIDVLLTDLEAADAAEAPEMAEAVARALAERLDHGPEPGAIR
jgi:hypothetical protein